MVTIYDVAKAAGVSSSTVSRVFNRPEMISEKTRDTVLRVSKELNFRPNYFASNLNNRKTLLIGLLLPDIQNPYSATLARGVQDKVTSAGYLSIICSTDGEPETELNVLQEMRHRGIDGFILTPPQLQMSEKIDEVIRQMVDDGVPTVFIGNRLDDESVSFVTSRAQDGATSAVNYLAELEHRTIGFIGGYYTRGVAVGRWLGYQEALIAHGLPLRPELMIEADLSIQGGADAMVQLLDVDPHLTAIFVVNDLMAIGAMEVCIRRGYSVPEDISIIGFDDIPLAKLTNPPLTTVAQPAYEIGYRAAEMLLQQCEDGSLAPQHTVLQCQLVIRESTTPLKKL